MAGRRGQERGDLEDGARLRPRLPADRTEPVAFVSKSRFLGQSRPPCAFTKTQ